MKVSKVRGPTLAAALGTAAIAVALAAGGTDIVESFDTNDFEDTAFVGASPKAAWNPAGQPGSLVGVTSSSFQEVLFSPSSGDVVPWNSGQARCQNLYTAAQMGGTPRTITGFAWRTASGGAPAAATYANVSVLLGHCTGALNPNFTGSFAGSPTKVVNGVSYTPSTAQSNWIGGPAFESAFAYDGTNRIVLEIGTAGGAVQNPCAGTSSSGALTMIRQINNGGASFTFMNHDVRFLTMVDASEARSLWYDSMDASPDYLDPVVQATVPSGTGLVISYQGAPEDPAAPGSPDLASLSGWTDDPAGMLSGLRFLRFHVALRGDASTGAVPSVEEIQVPVAGDTQPPAILTLEASPIVLWPANKRMIPVEIVATASDDQDPAPAIRILSITSNEPVRGHGAGTKAPDWKVVEGDWAIDGALLARLRAERMGAGTGRVYTIVVECRDAAGNATERSVEVVVPHDMDEDQE